MGNCIYCIKSFLQNDEHHAVAVKPINIESIMPNTLLNSISEEYMDEYNDKLTQQQTMEYMRLKMYKRRVRDMQILTPSMKQYIFDMNKEDLIELIVEYDKAIAYVNAAYDKE